MADREVPIVAYLELGEHPRLVALQCAACQARFFGHRDVCASCGGIDFDVVGLPTTGVVRTFTIVHAAMPGVPVPFAAAVIDCGGTSVRANVINTPIDPDHIRLGMAVRLATYSLGTDENGTEAVGFGFEPSNNEQRD